MTKNNVYYVPADQRRDFNLLVQRANRRIKASFKYIQEEKGITDPRTLGTIFGDYAYDQSPTPYSRSIKFQSESAYKAYKRSLMRWGEEVPKNVKDPTKYLSEKKIKQTRKGYIQNATQALNTLATELGIPLDNGKLPENLYHKLSHLSTEQLTHFFDEDIGDMIDGQRWGSDQYEGADRDQFVDITIARINTLKQLYPRSQNKSKGKSVKKKKSKKKATKRKK